jgi:hypothetical protein
MEQGSAGGSRVHRTARAAARFATESRDATTPGGEYWAVASSPGVVIAGGSPNQYRQ